MTRSGYRNDANRAGGNGPMDDTSQRIVQWVHRYSPADVTAAISHAVGNIMVDSIAALIAGFESEPARICAKLARTVQSDLKCTVLGYGIITSPELAAFANGCMLRHTDFNDLGPGGHVSDILSGILAVGEAVHASGQDVLTAVVIGYEIAGALQAAGAGTSNGFGWDGPYEGPATAMAAGKLLKLSEDQLANALSLSLVAHLPMSVTHVGALSHWKGCHAPEAVKCAVWSALLAQAGMTGPAQPFEGRQGWWDHIGPFVRELKLPAQPEMVVQRMGFKRTPTEGSSQAILEVIPQFRAWTRVDEIEAVHIELAQGGWMEIGDPPKWDPRNRETADHSMPYMIARSLMDGELYLDSFTPDKFMDPAARRLMDRITMSANPKCAGLGPYRITVRKKSGDRMVKEWLPPTVDPR